MAECEGIAPQEVRAPRCRLKCRTRGQNMVPMIKEFIPPFSFDGLLWFISPPRVPPLSPSDEYQHHHFESSTNTAAEIPCLRVGTKIRCRLSRLVPGESRERILVPTLGCSKAGRISLSAQAFLSSQTRTGLVEDVEISCYHNADSARL